MPHSAFITGLAGQTLTAPEASFLRSCKPAGIILFARNIDSPDQVRRLISDARDAIGDSAVLVLIDQEGGRVQRLRPPHWRALPPSADFLRASNGDRAKAAAMARLIAELTAADLRALGINTNCAPVLDLPVPGSHDIIGNRAYGTGFDTVVPIAQAVAEGYMAGGILPVIKHIPGHGRATADSHLELPTVTTSRAELDATDFAPFWALSLMPAAMTAHVVFTAIDPDHPASTSRVMIETIIRGKLGYGGLLMSDDLSMKALVGSMPERTRAVMTAGSDLALHCNGDLGDMEAVAANVPPLANRAKARFDRAFAVTTHHQPCDEPAAKACLARILALSA
jgi:beta-N-acetylhexosaminidase